MHRRLPRGRSVIIALIDESVNQLANGAQVNLGKLGSFSVNLKSGGVETEDDFTPAQIKGAKVIYRPGSEIKDMLRSLKYAKQ